MRQVAALTKLFRNREMEIQKVFAHDFEGVYELIKKYDSVRNKQFYQNLFVKHWQTEEDFFGFMIIENGKVIAYLGLIFSKREIHCFSP